MKTLDFGSTPTGTTSAAQTVTLSAGSSSVSIARITFTGASAASFAQTSTCPATLAATATCVITITFTPSVLGPLSATLTIEDNSPNSPQTVALTGVGGISSASAVLSANLIDFGSQTVGAPAISQTVIVSNRGNAPLNFSNITLAGVSPAGVSTPFQLSGTCSATAPVTPGNSCSLIVSYAPNIIGTQTASLTLIDNSLNSPQSISISGTAYSGLPFTATVLSGSQPVSGATLQVLAAGTTGNGSASSSLLGTTFTTDVNGKVAIPGQYNCPAAKTQIYLVSRGGIVGAARAANTNLVLMSAVGSCSNVVPNIQFVVNEATTVAAAAALTPFYSIGGNVGASQSNTVGLANAFATATELTSSLTGSSPGASLPSNVSSPAPIINSLANVVNSCASSATTCDGFFSSATPPGGAVPQNTLDAIFSVLRNPANNVAALYTASLASTAYSPALTGMPSDWTVFVTLSGGGLAAPSGIGVDSEGSVWVANYFDVASKFNSLGAPKFANGIMGSGLSDSYGLAVDLYNNVWIPNELPATSAGTGSVSEFTPDGSSLAGATGYTAGGLNYPIAAAIDPISTTWVVDYGNAHLTLLNSSGIPLSGTSGYTSSYFAFPVAVAIDKNRYGWIANQSGTSVTRVSPDGAAITNYDCCNGASGVAIDQGNNVWVANYYGSSVSLISNSGSVLSNGYTASGSLNHPQGIAVDGAGNIWLANFRAPYLTALAGTQSGSPGAPLTPTSGYGADAHLLEAYALAIDASGNIWVTNFGNNTVTKFIGLAVPVKTPLSALPQLP